MRAGWPLAAGMSVAAHAVLLGGLALSIQPQPVSQQQMPQAKLDVAAADVARSTAVAAEPVAEPASAAGAGGASVGTAALPRSTAAEATLPATAATAISEQPAPLPAAAMTPAALPATDAAAARIAAAAPSGAALAALPPAGATATAAPTLGAALADAPIRPTIAVAAAPNAVAPAPLIPPMPAAPAVTPQDITLAVLRPDAPRLQPGTTTVTPTLAAAAPATPVAAAPPPTEAGLSVAPPTAVLPPQPAKGGLAPALAPPSTFATADLAWTGEGGSVDPISVAAIAAFMQPGDLAGSSSNAGDVRDGIGAVLAGVPCARLQTVFVPETGEMELRGHIPEDALRAPVIAALQGQIGAAIPVSDRLKVLPRPQCGALSGIAAVGLPQSDEQESDPRIIGPDAFVRDYRYAAGQRLRLDLTAPDYDSVVYVDYFDASGNVIHLQPNDVVPLERFAPKAAFAVGRESPDRPALDLTISPPFGQEIAVAFAASAPLYDGLRPMVEPAGPYLEFLAERVALARAETPDFKGEWVYFFISTAAE